MSWELPENFIYDRRSCDERSSCRSEVGEEKNQKYPDHSIFPPHFEVADVLTDGFEIRPDARPSVPGAVGRVGDGPSRI